MFNNVKYSNPKILDNGESLRFYTLFYTQSKLIDIGQSSQWFHSVLRTDLAEKYETALFL